MSKKWSNKNLPGALHFVTGNVNHRKKIFLIDSVATAFFEELRELTREMEAKLIAFVLMPDHFHLIVNPRDGNICGWIGALKSLTARKITEIFPEGSFAKSDEENQVWQESFKAIPLWSSWMIWQKINYIHNNPLKARLVDSAKDYRWSSFRSFYNLETEELLAVDKEWWFEDDPDKLRRALEDWSNEILQKQELRKRQGRSD